MKMKRAVIRRAMMIAVLAVAIAALIVPLVGSRTQAAGNGAPAVAAPTPAPAPPAPAVAAAKQGNRLSNGQTALPADGAQAELGAVSLETRQALGFNKVADPKAVAEKFAQRLLSAGKQKGGDVQIQAGEPELLAGNAAFSAAIFTAISGRDTQFDEVALLADWDGREDTVADRAHKVDDFSGVAPDIDFVLTRTAISEHTIANGFAENVFYYGDSVGNVWVGVDTTGDARVDQLFQINLPTVLNAFGIWRWLGRQAKIEEGAAAASQASERRPGESLFPVSLLMKAPVEDPSGKARGSCVDAMAGCSTGKLSYVVMSRGGIGGVGETLRRLPWENARFDGDRLIADQFNDLAEIPKDQWPAR